MTSSGSFYISPYSGKLPVSGSLTWSSITMTRVASGSIPIHNGPWTTSSVFLSSSSYIQSGYVYAPYIPMTVTLVLVRVPEYTPSGKFPWFEGTVVKYLDIIYLVLESEWNNHRQLYEVILLDQEGRKHKVETDVALSGETLEILQHSSTSRPRRNFTTPATNY